MRVPVARVTWSATVAVAVLTAVLLLLAGYTGYGVVALAVAASAAVNLR